MPAEFIRQRERVTVVTYALFHPHTDSPGSGYGPDCDEQGNVDLSKMEAPSRANWDHIQDCNARGVPSGYDKPYVKRYEHSYWEPAVIRCACGRECSLYGPENDCDCGRIYNNFGQEYRPRHEWAEAMEAAGERWDDDY